MATILAANSGAVEASSEGGKSWQSAMKSAIRSGAELCEALQLDPTKASSDAEKDFPVFVPQELLQRMEVGNPRDPVFLQVCSGDQELRSGGKVDPVGDLDCQRTPGMLQKYAGRVLLIVSGACAVHCRYCFRRHFPYSSSPKGQVAWDAWLSEIEQDTSIAEVILSGGDPLTLTDDQLATFVDRLNGIQHVARLRLHTRLPVVIPQRVCPDLVAWIRNCRATVYCVLHINHVNEIDSSVVQAMKQLQASGVSLLNQAVLLRGVNDDVASLERLCLRLVDLQVRPYYLHQLDPVQGAMHFEVADNCAEELVDRLRARLPGYAVPELVREIPGRTSKTPLHRS